MTSHFSTLVVSYSVEDFKKQTPSTIPQNRHVAIEDVDNLYFSVGNKMRRNIRLDTTCIQHTQEYEIHQRNKNTLITPFLDVLLTTKLNGLLGHAIYNKSAHI